MTRVSTVTTFTYRCDRCGGEETSNFGAPNGWRLLSLGPLWTDRVQRALARPGDPGTTEICAACVASFNVWLEGEDFDEQGLSEEDKRP